ncbi:hypothetical protein KJ966_19660 [bacterium]|nr:hypothetical protein [bacterium]
MNRLKQTLKPAFNWHGARIDFFAKFIIALVKVSSVNFTHIAAAIEGEASFESNYKRIQRYRSVGHIVLVNFWINKNPLR